MTRRDVVAANVRARIAWLGVSGPQLAAALGWKERTTFNKLRGTYSFTADELAQLADYLGLADPGPLYRVPETFTVRAPVREPALGLVPSTKEQPSWSEGMKQLLRVAQERAAQEDLAFIRSGRERAA